MVLSRCKKLGGRRIAFLLLTFAQTAVVNSTFAVVAPFLPLYATEIGMSQSSVATIFGAFAAAQLIMSPVAGGLASHFGRRRVLGAGVCMVSASTVAFGAAAAALAGRSVAVLAVVLALLRVVQGTGAALATTCIFAILTDAFPAHKGAVIGAANACDGAGWTIGPPIGGLLYVAGGFQLPFYVAGPLPALLLLGQLAVMPTTQAAASAGGAALEDSAGQQRAAVIGFKGVVARGKVLLGIRTLLLTAAAGTIFTSKWGFIDIAFTRWCIEEFGFSLSTASIYFSIPAAAFLFIAPLGGLVVDRVGRKRRLIGAGLVAMGLSGLGMGVWQLRVLGNSARHSWLIFYLISEGVLSPLIMPAMLPDMLDSAAADGRSPADEHTTNIVTSIFTTAFNAGGMIGPLAGAVAIPWLGPRWALPGEAADVVGFRLLTAAFAVAFLVVGLLIAASEVAQRYSGYRRVGAMQELKEGAGEGEELERLRGEDGE